MPEPRITVPLDDPRITKYLTWFGWPETEDDARHDIARLISDFQAAGLVVIDPDDEAVILRLAKAYHAQTQTRDEAVIEGDIDAVTWNDDLKVIRQSYLADIRVILAALRDGA
jgi:hypothetical protein